MRNKSLFSALIWLTATLLLILGFTYIGPAEKILGSNVRIVYLHGAWVWTSLAAFVAAGACGLFGVISQTPTLQHWSRSLGRTGLLFWITYLPISIWAMQTSWNGLYLAEPRFRLAIIFAVVGLLVQSGVTLLENPAWASIGNLVYVIWLILALVNTQSLAYPGLFHRSLRINLPGSLANRPPGYAARKPTNSCSKRSVKQIETHPSQRRHLHTDPYSIEHHAPHGLPVPGNVPGRIGGKSTGIIPGSDRKIVSWCVKPIPGNHRR
jgi:hypothetical protein